MIEFELELLLLRSSLGLRWKNGGLLRICRRSRIGCLWGSGDAKVGETLVFFWRGSWAREIGDWSGEGSIERFSRRKEEVRGGGREELNLNTVERGRLVKERWPAS